MTKMVFMMGMPSDNVGPMDTGRARLAGYTKQATGTLQACFRRSAFDNLTAIPSLPLQMGFLILQLWFESWG